MDGFSLTVAFQMLTKPWKGLFYLISTLLVVRKVRLFLGIIRTRTNFSIDFILNLGELGRGILGVQRVDSI